MTRGAEHLDVLARIRVVDDEIGRCPFGEALASYPNMVWFTQEVILVPGYSFTREFEPGLDLVLDGIQSRLSSTD